MDYHEKLERVQGVIDKEEALPECVLPAREDFLAMTTGSRIATQYLCDVIHALWQQNQRQEARLLRFEHSHGTRYPEEENKKEEGKE